MRNSVADQGCFIPDPDPTIAPSRIPDPDLTIAPSRIRIPDPGDKKAPNPGFRIRPFFV
jgi:hypothetical protein